MDRSAFLSIRVPPGTRSRLKALAAARGQSVQDLVGDLVERFLTEQDRRAPALAEVVARLRGREAELRARGVASLAVFGSVARGDAGPESDVDLAATFDPAARVSLTGLAALRADLAEVLGAPADVVEWEALRPAMRSAARREAVRVF
jgi:predicted nucleotidyltransferase